MKNKLTHTWGLSILPLCAAVLALGGCATSDEVESESVTSALDFEEEDRFAVDVPDTSRIDTAFSAQIRTHATETLIDELEDHGFEYVGERDPDLRVSFATYAVSDTGYVDTSLPIVDRVVYQDDVATRTQRTLYGPETISTASAAEPIYVSSPSRLFILDVMDSGTNVLLWRAYTREDGTGLTEEQLERELYRLVERLEDET